MLLTQIICSRKIFRPFLIFAMFITPLLATPAWATIIDFDDTVAPVGGSIIPSLPYIEDGFELINGTSNNSNGLFDGQWSGGAAGNGTDFFGWTGGSATVILQSIGAATPFSIQSFDGGNLSTQGLYTWSLLGFVNGGGTVSANFTTTNTGLSNYIFGSGWSNLDSIAFTSGSANAALDSIVVNTFSVPEPSIIVLLGIGLAGMRIMQRKNTRT